MAGEVPNSAFVLFLPPNVFHIQLFFRKLASVQAVARLRIGLN